MFSNLSELCDHLRRFGLPDTCHFDKITEQQREELEIRICMSHTPLFQR